MDEVPFLAEVKSWIDSICAERKELPFARAEIDRRKVGRRERRDLVLLTRDNRIALSGEAKLPDQPEGKSPYNEALVLDAHKKAAAVGTPHFFTWNINRFVLWETFRPETPIAGRSLDYFDWADIRSAGELDRPEIREKIRAKVEEFLFYFDPIYQGARPFPRRPLDQWFIHLLESALDAPWWLAHAAIYKRYHRDNGFRKQLNDWVRTHLGATISAEYEEDNLIRAAKFSCYVIANKVVFYDALRRRYGALPVLRIAPSVKTASELHRRLTQAFRRAERESGDYETVFQGEDFGERLPFLEDLCVDAWRELMEAVDAYDFTSIDYGIIGHIFDRLISPDERHRYGQHYTKSEIVDVINAFSIRSPRARVLDPACGGGTFLVRAYARKKWLAARAGETAGHGELISDIYGVDISAYATHLSTISLATRELIRAPNYPRIAARDFFQVRKGAPVFPAGRGGNGDGDGYYLAALDEVDAIVGNPPYVRQEDIPPAQKKTIRQLCEIAWPGIRLSGRSDIHVYFWPYATSFLPRDEGYFGFLTSSSWLDVEYGFALQRWVLANFSIVAILESSAEPWFTDARVNTAVTILRRERDPKRCAANLVRFVQIRRPLADILLDFERGADRLEAAERVRDFIESRTKNHEDANWRIRVVKQSELISPDAAEKEGNPVRKMEEPPGSDPASSHTGGKWGTYLRAPDIFFELKERRGERLIPLSRIAEIRRGITSGCDAFFFPRDVTDDLARALSEEEFRERYGIRKRETERVRLCLAGDGSAHLIEAKYLEPEVHSLMEVQSVEIDPADLKHKVLLVSERKSALRRKHVLDYIRWGEEQGFDRRPTCAGRAKNRPWYDLAPNRKSDILWPMTQKYRHVVPLNNRQYVCNHRLFDVYAGEGVDAEVLCAVLNSTIVAFTKNFYGRWAGTEGTLDTEVVDVERLPVPDPRTFSPECIAKIQAAFRAFWKKPTLHLRQELSIPERKELDSAVLNALGFGESEIGPFLDNFYACVDRLYAEYRAIERQANANRARAARRGRSTPQSIAAEIWEALLADELPPRPFPQAFLPSSPKTEIIKIPDGPAHYDEDLFDGQVVQVGTTRIKLGDRDRAHLLLAMIREGYSGAVSLPTNGLLCRNALREWLPYREELAERFEELAASRTGDERTQERIVRDLWRRYRRLSQEG